MLTVACGHKKSPTPPPSKVPQTVTLEAHQRGHEVVVRFPFPTITISGTLLPGISKIEIAQFGVEVPEFAVELLAQEAEARKEAQALLDELGLPLYEVPVIDPATAGTGALDASGMPVAGPDGTPPAGTAMDPQAPISSAAPAGGFVDPEVAAELRGDELATETTAEVPLDEPATDPATGDEGEDEGESDDEAGESTDLEDGESTEAAVELSPEEQQALEVEAARTLLKSPPTPKSSFITTTSKDFKQGAEIVATVEGDDINRALVGDKVVFRLPLPPRPTEGPEIGYLFSATVYALNGKPSDPSPRVAILPTDTPPAPRNMQVEAQAGGVYLTWEAEEDTDGGFKVYRRDAQTRLYGEPVATLTIGTERFHLDRQAIFGARYIYGVTAVESTTPLLESDLSTEREIDYRDSFGPAMPSGLVAFPETGRVRLLWTTVADLDVAGYEISRRDPDETAPTPITEELVTRGQYVDEAVASGEIWFYSVVAVDTTGNRSPASAETQVRVP